MRLSEIVVCTILAMLTTVACDSADSGSQADRQGYILKKGEGERLEPNTIIKASPQSGTQGGVMVLDTLPPGFYTGLHTHDNADEFFYVISGTGFATLGDQTSRIEAGDVVFVGVGGLHEIKVAESGGMELLYFVDRPGLDGFFRAVHARATSERMTLDECNEIGSKYGLTCVTN